MLGRFLVVTIPGSGFLEVDWLPHRQIIRFSALP